jgi:hypothetical protein
VVRIHLLRVYFFNMAKKMRSPGIEPGSITWQATIITTRPRTLVWSFQTFAIFISTMLVIFIINRCWGGEKKYMTPEGIEPPIFGSGIRRVAIAPWSRALCKQKGIYVPIICSKASVAEWLRRQTQVLVLFEGVSSNLTGCKFLFFAYCSS